MAKKISSIKRIDTELDKVLKEMAMKNSISYVEASREVANQVNKIRFTNRKITRDLKW